MINNDNNLFFLAKDSQTASTRDGRRCCFQSHQSPRQFPVDCFFRFVCSSQPNNARIILFVTRLPSLSLLSFQFNQISQYPIPLLAAAFFRSASAASRSYLLHTPSPPPCFFKSLFSSCKSLIFSVVHALDRLICLYLYLYLYLYPCYPRILNPF